MIKNLLSALFIGATVFSFGQATNYPNGSTVSDFTVTDSQGNSHTLYDITSTGKYVFLDFFFTACGPCQQTQTYFNELHDKYGCNDGDIFVMSINNGNDNNAQVDAFEQQYGGPWHHSPVVSNEGGGQAVDTDFGISQYPTYVLIGPDNKMITNDIWPISDVSTFEGALPIQATEMECTFAGIVEDTDVMSGLTVYPNPAQDLLNISFKAQVATNATVEIMNLMGQVIYTENIATSAGTNVNPINVENLADGQYIAKIVMNDQIATVKFNKK